MKTWFLGDPEWTCVGKPCGTLCPWGHCPHCRPGFGAGICDNKTESCVSAFYNPCAVHGCEAKLCGDQCLNGDIMYQCDANGYCNGYNHICPKGIVPSVFNSKIIKELFQITNIEPCLLMFFSNHWRRNCPLRFWHHVIELLRLWKRVSLWPRTLPSFRLSNPCYIPFRNIRTRLEERSLYTTHKGVHQRWRLQRCW